MSDLFIFLSSIPQVIDILNMLPIQKSNFYINSNLQFPIEYLLQMTSQSENHIKAFYQYLALSKLLEEPVIQLNNLKLALNICEDLNQHYSQYCKTLLQPYNSKFQLSILRCQNIEQLLEYLECFLQSMNYGVNFSDLLLLANSKFSELFLQIHSSFSWQEPDSSATIINILNLLKKFKDLSIDIETFYTMTCESLLLYMSNLVFLYRSQQNIEIYKRDLPKIRDHLKILAPQNEYYKKFQDFFKIIWLLSEDDVTLDLTKLTEISDINVEDYFNVALTVFKAKYTGELKNGITQYICIRKYTYKISHMDLFFIKDEIKALKKMNKEKSENNAFGAYYGAKYLDNSLYLYTEYHDLSLWQVINNCISSNSPLPNTIIDNVYTLIYTLSSLKSLELAHGNINPYNILITSTLKFCLVDITMLKHQLLSTHPKTYSKSIYSAPELFLKKNQNFFSEELIKADIYSMGMIMLQISNKQEIRGLNMIENDTQLKKCIAGVEESWIRDVLMHMLCRDPDARLDGIALTKFLPKKFTLPN